jgi:NAD(P)-dependent dehydrogenase (short-subunit alcohol dehydrogenase family)
MSLIAGVTANSVHPGAVATDVWRKLPKIVKVPFVFITKFFFKVCDANRTTLTVFI